MMYGQAPSSDYGPYEKRGLDSCGQCVKYLMAAMNFIFFLLACAVIGLGVYFLVETDFLDNTFGTVLATVAAWMLVISGGIVCLISFLGCIGALNENRCMLMVYFAILIILFLFCLTAGILGVVFYSQIGDRVRTEMAETLKDDYGVRMGNSYNQAVTNAWDKLQSMLYCCSVDDHMWNTYRASNWYKSRPETPAPFVPKSCCRKDQYGEYVSLVKCQTWNEGPPGKTSGIANEALHYSGCYNRGKQFIKDVSGYIIGLGMAMAICMLVGMFFSVFLFRRL